MADPWPCVNNNEYGVQKLANGWYRIWTRFQSTSASSYGMMYLYPVYHGGTTLSPNRDNSVPGNTYFWGAQVERGGMLTSYIPTSGGVASRSADFVSVSSPGIASGAGTYRIEWSTQSTIQNQAVLMRYSDGSTVNFHEITATSNDVSGVAWSASTNQYTASSSTTKLAWVGKTNQSTYHYSATSAGAALNARHGSVSGSYSIPSGLNAMELGGYSGSPFYLNGHILRVHHWSNAFSPPVQKSLTMQ